MTDLPQWLSYLETLHPTEIDLGLERVSEVAARLELLNFKATIITVGGTNGKGSTVKTLERIYLSAGYKVAAYTSPHLLKFNERLRINGIDVDDNHLVTAFQEIECARKNISLTYFEFTTLAALWICQKTALDIIVLEVGMGGRLDAVNIIEPDICAITNIDIDHTQWLGNDRESIGREKAGIIRSKKPVVCGDRNPPQSLIAAADEKQAPFICVNQDFFYQQNFSDTPSIASTWNWQGMKHNFSGLPMPYLSLENVATAIAVVEQLMPKKPVNLAAVKQGIDKISLAGRFEIVGQQPLVILDVAHNPASFKFLAQQLQIFAQGRRITAVIAMLKDKDILNSVTALISLVEYWYVAGLPNISRAASFLEMQQALAAKGAKVCYNGSTVEEALMAALEKSAPTDCILVCGSFYTVAKAKQFLQYKHATLSF